MNRNVMLKGFGVVLFYGVIAFECVATESSGDSSSVVSIAMTEREAAEVYTSPDTSIIATSGQASYGDSCLNEGSMCKDDDGKVLGTCCPGLTCQGESDKKAAICF